MIFDFILSKIHTKWKIKKMEVMTFFWALKTEDIWITSKTSPGKAAAISVLSIAQGTTYFSEKFIFLKKRPKIDLIITWFSLFEVSRVTWWWKWWRFLTFDPTAFLAACGLGGNFSQTDFGLRKCAWLGANPLSILGIENKGKFR